MGLKRFHLVTTSNGEMWCADITATSEASAKELFCVFFPNLDDIAVGNLLAVNVDVPTGKYKAFPLYLYKEMAESFQDGYKFHYPSVQP